ncbi:Putative 8-oxo-dGTP diphosphatase [Durusdinium trenchii]
MAAAAWRVPPPRELRAELPLVRHYKEQVSAAFVALFRGEELFLVRGRQSGLWQLPGGMIEASDLNVWDAAAREFYEETGSQAPLPSSRLQGWFETTIELPSGGLFRGVIFVLQTEATCEVPFAVNGETREALWRPWRNLEDLDFRWPNDQTIPQIFDMAQAEDGRRPVVRAGCYMEMRPTLRCGGHMRESAPEK